MTATMPLPPLRGGSAANPFDEDAFLGAWTAFNHGVWCARRGRAYDPKRFLDVPDCGRYRGWQHDCYRWGFESVAGAVE